MMNRQSETGPARFCVTNAKGGTGKTTVAINVAGALNDRGRDVLFIDLDPQGNATEGVGLVEAYDADPPTLFDALTGDPSALGELICEGEEMDVIPSSIDMLQAEHELTIADLIARVNTQGGDIDQAALASFAINITPEMVTGSHALDTLDRALSTLDADYDYVIIDCPPFYGKLTDTGMYAAQNVLIPALTEATSERAIELLMDQMAAMERQTDASINTLGVVANRVETTSEDETMLEWFNMAFPDSPVWEVRKRVALQRAFSAGQSIFATEESCDMAAVFEDIAAELDEQFGFTDTEVPA
ncbi:MULTISPECIES: ParA family protein [Haloarcula]|uniref:ParA family protein n=3 Tax=Haloarcula TaxID=2237 RepID=A0ABU2F115_HALAR|nr:MULTISPECIES: ParA family protein [Haloarcula]KAA9406652.1 ParA family protein [Haloarcula sp. CBA1131]KAA9411208.1 ParA family protein [Haloarcula hispanica]MDS0253913.1 ParA family protein [Haloarcula argentinensis]